MILATSSRKLTDNFAQSCNGMCTIEFSVWFCFAVIYKSSSKWDRILYAYRLNGNLRFVCDQFWCTFQCCIYMYIDTPLEHEAAFYG